MTSVHAPTELLADYAAGTLRPGMQLLVASHLTFCPACRSKAARLAALGGAFLGEMEPVATGPRCLAGVLARIAGSACAAPVVRPRAEPLPEPLRLRLPAPMRDLPWRPVRPGLSECRLEGFPGKSVGLLRGSPGVPIRCPDAEPAQASTLVLAGVLRDGLRTWTRGDLALAGPNGERRPETCGAETCLCLMVAPADPDGDPRPASA